VEVTEIKGSMYLLVFIAFIIPCLGYATTFQDADEYAFSSKNRTTLHSPAETSPLSDNDWLSHYFDNKAITEAVDFIATADRGTDRG